MLSLCLASLHCLGMDLNGQCDEIIDGDVGA